MKLKPVFEQSIRIVWENPILWLLGFFAAIFANNEINLLVINFQRINNWIDQLITFRVAKTYFQQIISGFDFGQLVTYSTLYYLILGVILILLLLYLSFISQILIISLVKKFSFKGEIVSRARNKKTALKNLSNHFIRNKKFLWPIAGLYIIVLLITYGFLFLLNLPIFYKIPVPIIIYIILFLILVLLLSFMLKFVIFFIVLEKQKILAAIKKGFIFFFKNWLIVIKTSVYLFLLTIIFGLILFLISLGTSLPFLTLLSLCLFLKFIFGFQVLIIFWIALLGIIFILLTSIFSSFLFSVWTILFLKLNNK